MCSTYDGSWDTECNACNCGGAMICANAFCEYWGGTWDGEDRTCYESSASDNQLCILMNGTPDGNGICGI